MSESMRIASIITFSGGLQDAYTYFARGKVFANAQTGNIVLMSEHLFNGDWEQVIHYLIPLAAFAAGIFAAEQIQGRYRHIKAVHWRQIVILIEIFVLILAGFVPSTMNFLANAFVSFACAMQVQTFRKFHGHAYASTMCIGNMRSSMASISAYTRTHNKRELITGLSYFLVILIFALGAGFGYVLVERFGLRTVWISPAVLIIAFFIMFMNTEKAEGNTTPSAVLKDIEEEEKEILHPVAK